MRPVAAWLTRPTATPAAAEVKRVRSPKPGGTGPEEWPLHDWRGRADEEGRNSLDDHGDAADEVIVTQSMFGNPRWVSGL